MRDRNGLLDFKKQLVREVVGSIQGQVEEKTAAAVDTLWQRGQRVMHEFRQQQKAQAEQLQGQLAACAGSYQRLQQENAMLRSSLEALMKHLTLVFGPPPHVGQHVPHPQTPFPLPRTPTASAAASRAVGLAAAPSGGGGECGDGAEDFKTPPVSPVCSDGSIAALARDPQLVVPQTLAPQLPQHLPPLEGAAAATPGVLTHSGGTGSDSAGSELAHLPASPATGGGQIPAFSFSVKLRRADQVPLGLDLQADADARHLIVHAVRPEGAVGAWNRQCAGDAREIRPGDRIVRVNDAEDPHAMGQECLAKVFLKMVLLRGSDEQARSMCHHGARGLRADADEFVPQVGAPPA